MGEAILLKKKCKEHSTFYKGGNNNFSLSMRENSAERNTVYRVIDVEIAVGFGEWQASLTSGNV